MPYYEQKSRSRLSLDLNNNSLVTLIAIILVVFVLVSFVSLIYYFGYSKEIANTKFYNEVYTNLAIPAETDVLLRKPWTLITHMFYHFHGNIWHLIGNLIWLWFFGYILHDLTGNRKLIPVFLYGAFGGALAFLLAYNLIPTLNADVSGANAIGSSAGVMGIAVVTTMIAPGFRIFPFINGGIPLWVITMIFVVIDLATIPVSNQGGHIAHIAGALSGFLFFFFYRRGYDGSEWMNNLWDWFSNLFNPDKPRSTKPAKEQLFYRSDKKPYSKTANLSQQKIDEILDKISEEGYDSLTNEEKDLLNRASKEDM